MGHLDRALSVAFTGNRQITAPRGVYVDDLCGLISESLSRVLEELYHEGKRIFLSGGAVGFDLLAAEAVLRLRERCSDVQLVVVVPFIGQELKYSPSQRQRYDRVVSMADRVVVLEPKYSIAAYHLRNEYLIEHSSFVVAYSNGRGRGTASTLSRAIANGVKYLNVFDLLGGSCTDSQLSLDL